MTRPWATSRSPASRISTSQKQKLFARLVTRAVARQVASPGGAQVVDRRRDGRAGRGAFVGDPGPGGGDRGDVEQRRDSPAVNDIAEGRQVLRVRHRHHRAVDLHPVDSQSGHSCERRVFEPGAEQLADLWVDLGAHGEASATVRRADHGPRAGSRTNPATSSARRSRLVLHRERPGVVDPLEPGARDVGREPLAGVEELVVARPGDQHRPVERAELLDRLHRVAAVRGAHELREVGARLGARQRRAARTSRRPARRASSASASRTPAASRAGRGSEAARTARARARDSASARAGRRRSAAGTRRRRRTT